MVLVGEWVRPSYWRHQLELSDVVEVDLVLYYSSYGSTVFGRAKTSFRLVILVLVEGRSVKGSNRGLVASLRLKLTFKLIGSLKLSRRTRGCGVRLGLVRTVCLKAFLAAVVAAFPRRQDTRPLEHYQ